MHARHKLFDHTLHHMGFSGEKPYFVVIGAMDGLSFDEFHGFIRSYRWSGLMVEPIPEQFRRLVHNFAVAGCSPHNRYENSAIAEHDGTVQMLTIKHEAIDAGEVASCFGGMSAIYPPRNGLASPDDAAVVERYGERIEVPCITLATLLTRHAVPRIDILCMDAEGWDFRILRQLDFTAWRPKLIRCEYINLDATEQAELHALLNAHHYVCQTEGQNIDAVASEHWRRISDHSRPVRPQSGTGPGLRNLTLVSSLLPLALDGSTDGLAAAAAEAAFRRRLGPAQSNIQLFIYSPAGAALLASQARNPACTRTMMRAVEDQRGQAMFARLCASAVRAGDGVDIEAMERSVLKRLTALNAPFLLNDATLYNPFGTDFFLWVDADRLAEAITSLESGEGLWPQIVAQLNCDARVFLSCHARDGTGQALLEPLWERWQDQSPGGPDYATDPSVFGGTRLAINALNGVYYACMDRVLEATDDDTPATLLTLASHSHPHLCNPQPLPAKPAC